MHPLPPIACFIDLKLTPGQAWLVQSLGWCLCPLFCRGFQIVHDCEEWGRVWVSTEVMKIEWSNNVVCFSFLFSFLGPLKDTPSFPLTEPFYTRTKLYCSLVSVGKPVSFKILHCAFQGHLSDRRCEILHGAAYLIKRISQMSFFLLIRSRFYPHAININLFEKHRVSVFARHVFRSRSLSYTIHWVNLWIGWNVTDCTRAFLNLFHLF